MLGSLGRRGNSEDDLSAHKWEKPTFDSKPYFLEATFFKHSFRDFSVLNILEESVKVCAVNDWKKIKDVRRYFQRTNSSP